MTLTVGSAGLLSLVFLPAIFLALFRLLNYPTDMMNLLVCLIVSEAVSLTLAIFVVVHFRLKARIPLPD